MKHRTLAGQVFVITGATSGIGLCTAQLAAQRGAKVVLVARSAGILESVAEVIRESGHDAIHIAADVADREQVAAAARAAIDAFGHIDTWVNNAGVSIHGRLDEVTEEDSRRLFDVNFWGVVNGSLVALPFLKERGGALINVGSEVSEIVLPLQGMYASSKQAVKGFTDALRIEVEEMDQASVSITLIQPAAVDTPHPQHARNYLQAEPTRPAHAIDPATVAHAILKAATEGGRDVKVGAMAKLNTAVARLMPGLGDKLAAKHAARHAAKDAVGERAGEGPRGMGGALYEPSESGRIHGLPLHGALLAGTRDE
ncbi:MAG: SDR family oxidoreductase [Pseudomonadota bacterium]